MSGRVLTSGLCFTALATLLMAALILITVACGASFVGPATTDKTGKSDLVNCGDGTSCPSGYDCTPTLSNGGHCEATNSIPETWSKGMKGGKDAGR